MAGNGGKRFLHSEQSNMLVQLGLVHAEFESFHPFLDANGRLGRMLIPLYLFDRKILRYPEFYLSEYLETNKDEYLERLLAVSRDYDWTWVVRIISRSIGETGPRKHPGRLGRLWASMRAASSG